MMNRENDVILAALKLARAMRRCPPDRREFAFPPAAGRLLECVAANSNVSSRELCEMLDVRPSSLSEMLARAEGEGWVTRTVDEDDRRILRIALSDKGQEIVARMRESREADYENLHPDSSNTLYVAPWSRGLRHRPFTAATRGRIPAESLFFLSDMGL